jgi:hypothetical protein
MEMRHNAVALMYWKLIVTVKKQKLKKKTFFDIILKMKKKYMFNLLQISKITKKKNRRSNEAY